MKKLGYLGIDQYGKNYKINKYPRKELLEQLGGTHADKIYVDTKDGITRHQGYVIGGLWIGIYEIYEWKSKKESK
tara:strand:- start:291 stop:515 length:225 start_codon:yes stop_codon:yes gene_type:complete